MTTTDHAAAIADIRNQIARTGNNCAAFAYSIDEIDQWIPTEIRNRAQKLAQELVNNDADDDTINAVYRELWEACKADRWARKEIAGRFLSCVRRLRLVRARHPRARRFESLVTALLRGRQTRKQLAFAKRLAAEVA